MVSGRKADKTSFESVRPTRREPPMITLIAATLIQAQAASNQARLFIGFARGNYSPDPIVVGKGGKYKVSFSNGTDKTIKLMTEGCSWGYEMLSFELTNPAGAKSRIERVPKGWDKNVPQPWPAKPGEVLIRQINFGDGTWQGLPSGVSGSLDGWKIRIVLSVQSEGVLTKGGFWTGFVTSKWSAAKPSSK